MKNPDFTYKQHIDGLRAVAVISVILFHLNPSFFPGGYLGVDVFFVISGFVITQSLYKNYIKTGQVQIGRFYLRRFKRLYPALVAMVTATSIMYAFYGFLWDTNLYLKSAVTSILASSNLYFLYHGENYFHQDLVNPLLHTWSLGVEEQFYFIYPLLLAGGMWFTRKYNIGTLVLAPLILGGSMLSYLFFYTGGDSLFGNFYFPFARFWELGVGCSLFFFSQFFTVNRFAKSVATVSFLGILGIQFFQNRIESLPIETLLIVCATAGVLYAGISGRGIVIDFLQHAVTTYIGRISYSLYLWHFPVIYFTYLYVDTIPAYILATILSVGFAVASYHFIEKPLRYSNVFDIFLLRVIKISPYILIGIVLIFIFIGQVSLRKAVNDSFNAVSAYVKPFNYIESNFNLGSRIQPAYTLSGEGVSGCSDLVEQATLVRNELGLFANCLKQVNSQSLFYLTGDSHAFHFLSAFDNSQIIENLYFIEIPRQSIVSDASQPYDSKNAKVVLQRQVEELKLLNQEFSDVYYFTSFFLSLEQDQIEVMESSLEHYIETLQEYAILVFMAPTPVFSAGPESCVLLGKHCVINKIDDLNRRQLVYDMLKAFERKYEKVFVYDAYDEICPGERCYIYNYESDFLAYMDQDHLSVEQSVKLSTHIDQWLEKTFDLVKYTND